MRREGREEEVQELKDERGQDWERGEKILQEFVVRKVYMYMYLHCTVIFMYLHCTVIFMSFMCVHDSSSLKPGRWRQKDCVATLSTHTTHW